NENENGRKKPKRPINQGPAKEAFQKTVESPDEPLEKILCSTGNWLHFVRGDLNKNDQAERHHPAEDHGIRNWEAEGTEYCDGLLRQAFSFFLPRRRGSSLFGSLHRHARRNRAYLRIRPHRRNKDDKKNR